MTYPPALQHRRLFGCCLLVMIAILLLFGQFDHDLWSPDEPREAGIAWEMLRSHDFIVPTLSGDYFIEKPPLFYWSVLLVNALTGFLLDPVNVLRLTCSLYGAGTLVCLWLAARRMFGEHAAYWSVLSLATMSGFLEHFHVIRTDVALAFFCAMSLWTLVAFYLDHRRWFALWTGIAISGAFLAKGPVAPLVMIPFWGMLFLHQLWVRGQHHWGQVIIDNLVLVAVAAVLCGGWCWALVSHQDGDWLWNEWFWRNQVGRVLGTAGLGHDEATTKLDYIPSMLSLTLAWVPLILAWFYTTLRAGRHMGLRHFLLLIGGVMSFLILSMAQTKRSLYLLPILPFFAMMAGQFLATHAQARWVRGYALFTVWAAFAFQLAVLLLPLYGHWLPTRHATSDMMLLISGNRAGQLAAVVMTLLLLAVMRMTSLGAVRIFIAAFSVFITWTLFMNGIQASRKSTRIENEALYQTVPEAYRAGTAGVGLSEVERGALAFYSNWRVGDIDHRAIQAKLDARQPFGLLVHGATYYQTLRPQLALWIAQEHVGYSRSEHVDDSTLTWVWLTFPNASPNAVGPMN